jgi:Fungal specific transcription factor domain
MKSADVTSQAEFTGLTTVFLDGCLHMFFSNFVPTFPIVHRPTFIFREWTHPLLLNAIALGSRFMFQKESSVKVCRVFHSCECFSDQVKRVGRSIMATGTHCCSNIGELAHTY